MNQEFEFLNLDGLEDHETEQLLKYLGSTSRNPNVTFPWDIWVEKVNLSKGDGTFLNVYAPAFQSSCKPCINKNDCFPNDKRSLDEFSYSNEAEQIPNNLSNCHPPPELPEVNGNDQGNQTNANESNCNDKSTSQANATKTNFKLDPTVSSFVPQCIPGITSQAPSINNSNYKLINTMSHQTVIKSDEIKVTDNVKLNGHETEATKEEHSTTNGHQPSIVPEAIKSVVPNRWATNASVASPPRSFADVLKSNKENRTNNSTHSVVKCNISLNDNHLVDNSSDANAEDKKSSLKEDKMVIALGRHLHNLRAGFSNISLQPRGLINRSNWCYINATLQALLACSPFYSLLRNLPIGPAVDRGKSSTPVLDSMVNLTYEFTKVKDEQEDLQPGSPFQPLTVYKMLGVMKPHCLKGLQEDAEEFLTYILNTMHEEMVTVMKNYEKQFNLNVNENLKTNGHTENSDNEEEWQVMGAKQRGMVTRKVVEHSSPISDLLGGQIKSFLTTSLNKTSASVQPFFALQLDIQSEGVTSVEEALSQMTVKEPIQGYTCPKTKQEVEAYSRILLQKIPPVLILHLKRFVYNRNGGCKKVMKQTEYPINLELKKEWFTPEARKSLKLSSYKLFAVMYHEGAEAGIGHYICDMYHLATKTWVRCDDRNITAITEDQVLSHSPPRVPYLLFYQACNPKQENTG